MTSAALQWIAFFTMIVDHMGYVFFPGVPALRAVGRISFPIFAFLLSEGFAHTANLKKYALRLFAFAVVSEIPYQLMINHRIVGFRLSNILFSLLLCLGALWCVRKGRGWLAGVPVLAVLAQAGGFSYGAYAVALAVCFYLTRDCQPEEVSLPKRALGMLCLAVCTILYCIYHHSTFQIWAIFAAVPLLFYNGQRGRRAPRYLLYILYPAHLALFVCLSILQAYV